METRPTAEAPPTFSYSFDAKMSLRSEKKLNNFRSSLLKPPRLRNAPVSSPLVGGRDYDYHLEVIQSHDRLKTHLRAAQSGG